MTCSATGGGNAGWSPPTACACPWPTSTSSSSHPRAIARLTYLGLQDRFSAKTGKQLTKPAARFTFPPQPIDPDIGPGSKLIVARHRARVVVLRRRVPRPRRGNADRPGQRRPDRREPGTHLLGPPPDVRRTREAGGAVATWPTGCSPVTPPRSGTPSCAATPPRFLPGHGPADGLFVGDYQHVCAWAPHLDRSYVPVQGPPGTGKTYTGAHVIHTLVHARASGSASPR